MVSLFPSRCVFRKSFKAAFPLIALIFHAITAHGQAAVAGLDPEKRLTQYSINHWTTEDGLPSNALLNVYKSKDGYLWLTTFDGLVRFDGSDFEVFGKRQFPDAFSTNSLLTLYENEEGLWIGTNGGGLIHKKGNSFVRYQPGEYLQGGIISAIEPGPDGALWLGSRSGIARFVQGAFEPIEHPVLGNANVYDMLLTSDSALYIGTTGDGLYCYRDGEYSVLTTQNGLLSNSIRSLYEDAQGAIWIGTDAGITVWQQGQVVKSYRVRDGLPSSFINDFLTDKRGNFWIATDGGLVRLAKDGTLEVLTEQDGLTHQTIQHLELDMEGSLWLATYRGGLNRLKDGKFTNYGMPEGMPDEVINAVEMVGDSAWIGTDKGLALIANREVRSFDLGSLDSENRVRDILYTRSGHLWLCTYGGLVRFGPRGVEQRITTAEGLSNNRVRSILEDSKGRIWIGTANGLNYIMPNGSVRVLNQQDGLDNEYVMGMWEHPDGSLWVGTNGGGVFIWREGVFQNLTTADGLPAGVVFSMMRDSQGFLWICTSGGLAVLENGETIRPLNRNTGLPVNSVFEIVEDEYDNYWITTDKGIHRINKGQLRELVRNERELVTDYHVFNKGDGMRSNETTGASHLAVDARGQLWVPTLKGVTVVDPNKLPINPVPPPVRITRVSVDGEPLATTRIIVPEGQHRVRFHFTALSFLAPEKVTFKYRLVGFDDHWIDNGNSRVADYTNLPPGSYSFEVIAANNDGVWNREGAALPLEKNALFVETIWFYLLIVFGVCIVGFVVYYVRLANLQRVNEQLQVQVAVRTQDIEAQKQAIEAQAQELETINKIVQTINQEWQLDKVLDSLLNEALRLFPQAERASFLVYNEEHKYYQFLALQGPGMEDFRSTKLTPEEAFHTFSEDYQELEEGVYIVRKFRDVEGKLKLDTIQSALVMTIKIGVFPDAFMFLISRTNPKAFDESDSQRLKRFRDHALSAYIKAKNLQELEERKKELELYYQNMNDSVQYARRIQEALLPGMDTLHKMFPNSFVFYQPKDVVSGDFYWYTQRGQRKIIAAVDCTGHGVPGAFMSVLGNTLLNQIVLERDITEASEILNELDRMTRKTLHHMEGNRLAQDGMDVALVVVDEGEQRISFAGAKRPLYFFQDGQLRVIKGDKSSIGGDAHGFRIAYAEHQLPLDEVQAFYLFSDGYYDQFSQASGKKFMVSRFKSLLREAYPKAPEQQYALVHDEIEAWMGEAEQVDDMLVIGVMPT